MERKSRPVTATEIVNIVDPLDNAVSVRLAETEGTAAEVASSIQLSD
jgi:hypothetical protein